jgi:hypothetical protein
MMAEETCNPSCFFGEFQLHAFQFPEATGFLPLFSRIDIFFVNEFEIGGITEI